MREVYLVLFLMFLERGSTEANATVRTLDVPVDHKVETNHLNLNSTETQNFRHGAATPALPTAENPVALVNTSHEDEVRHSLPQPTKASLGLQTPSETQEENPSTPTIPKGRINDTGIPNAKTPVLPNNTGISSQSQPRRGPLQSEGLKIQKGATGNRSSRQSDYTNSKTPSFETTRGKNWCAYVHTRLQPTIVVDNLENYASGRTKSCSWISGPCGSSSHSRTHQAYRIKHMIVTSLEWKCCPGYSGQTCQPKAQQDQLLIHSNQAESNAVVNAGTLGNRLTSQQQQDLSNPAIAQKMNEQLSSQEMKLTSLQKKVDNISVVMSDVSKTLSSLEGKINEDKGRDLQAFLKGLKSKSIEELVKEIVKDQIKVFQNDMQETLAQIFKMMSDLSENLESTKALVKGLNGTQQKFAFEIENRPAKTEILKIKSQILHIEEEISITCDLPVRDLQEKQKAMEVALEHQSSKSDIYYESLNKTLNQMKEVHEQLLSAERVSDQNIPTATGESVSDNITNYITGLHEKVKTQNLMVLQLYDDLRVQDSKINNLTLALEIQKDSLPGAFDEIFTKCQKEFQKHLKGAEDNVLTLNRTMVNLVLPLDDKMDKMTEQINDLCYDMEILQPLIEQGVPFSLPSDDEQQIEREAINRKLENLTSVVTGLSSTIKELTQSQKELKSEAQVYKEESERRINECFVLMEDGLNKTMVVMNSAVDSIQDNYVMKETLGTLRNETTACCHGAENIERILTWIPQFQQMNKSLQLLVNENQKRDFVTRTVPFSDSSSGGQDRIRFPDLNQVHQVWNTTTLSNTQHDQDTGRQEEQLLHPMQEREDHEVRLQAVEAKIAKFLANNCVTARHVKAALSEKDKVLSGQFQALSSRIKALEVKSIRVSVSIPFLNKTAYEARSLCRDVSARIQEVNASIPVLMQVAHPDIVLFQKGLQEFAESVLEIKTGTILSNLTGYIDKCLNDAVYNITKRLKPAPPVVKKPVTVKKTAVNTTSLSGRSQRNTDTASDPGDYLSCSSSPCQNGGTCVNERKGFICACRYPFIGATCSTKMMEENAAAIDFSKGSYRFAPMVAFFASHTYGMNTPGPIRFNNLDVNYGSSYVPSNGKFRVPYLGVYVFEYTIESRSPRLSGYLVVDGIDKLAFQSENLINDERSISWTAMCVTGVWPLYWEPRTVNGQEVWLRLATGSIPAKYPPVTTFTGYLLYRT
ncbi:LOW QUALITY PROTEIN: multimerin-1 [Sphaerodactylus townsendi]|uniref:LOW QUALITY PROTEIN: multimerin-1 n=1 Tax=Sphaerodactylus townsendi TaxID=933632 RepID=UPI002026FD80|nr:LOW QUALITY PROTEIN: multimerin-1 [Sphaerodactylus townsendi]